MAERLAKILIVDDSEINREIYRNALLGLPDVEILVAEDGVQALEVAAKHDFAIYLIDIVMPRMDGFELASLLREEKRTENVPILFVTSHEPDPELMMRGYRMGAVDYLVKVPVDVEILVRKVRVFLRMYRKRLELAETLQDAQTEIKDLHTRLEEYMLQHEQLRKQATHDTLTGLPNRALFQDRLDLAIRRAQRNKQRFALGYIDLDGFKAINDRYGHAAGDAMLVAVAERIGHAMRATDTAARLGGDEFAVLLEALDSTTGGEYAAGKILAAITAPLDLPSGNGHEKVSVQPGTSIGLAIFPDHAGTRDEIISLADMCMYVAKRSGGGVRVHQPKPAGDSFLDRDRPPRTIPKQH